MPEKKLFKLEGEPKGLLWLAQFSNVDPVPYCEQHEIPLELNRDWKDYSMLFCSVDHANFQLRNGIDTHKRLVLSMIFKDNIKDLSIVRIDNEGSRVLAKEKVKLLEEYWIETKVSNTASGVQIMIQVGKRNGSGEKVQMFVDPPRQRLSFDISDKDTHPAGIFTKVEAIFKDSVTIIEPKE